MGAGGRGWTTGWRANANDVGRHETDEKKMMLAINFVNVTTIGFRFIFGFGLSRCGPACRLALSLAVPKTKRDVVRQSPRSVM